MEYFTHAIDGVGELRFAHLTPYCIFGDPAKPEVNGFVPLDRQRRRRELIEDMRDTGVDKAQQLVELQAFRNEELGLHSFLDYLARPTAAEEVVRYAFRRANPTAELPALTPAQVMDVFWVLVKPLDIAPAKPKAGEQQQQPSTDTYGDGGADPTNPPIPPTYSPAPETGTATTGGGTGSPTAP